MKYNEFDENKLKHESVDSLDEFVDDPHDLDDSEFVEFARKIDLYDQVPEATDIAREIFVPTKNLALESGYNAEYRAWYGTRWCPQQSKFGGRGGKHKGVDLFVPSGTPLIALVGPARIQWNPKGNDGKWGNHIFLNFRWNDEKNYTLVYAHLKSLQGSAPRDVAVGEIICKSDCTGNAGGSGMDCGTDNPCGGRSDHVHLELFGPNGRIDSVDWLGWNVKYANESRCVRCQ